MTMPEMTDAPTHGAGAQGGGEMIPHASEQPAQARGHDDPRDRTGVSRDHSHGSPRMHARIGLGRTVRPAGPTPPHPLRLGRAGCDAFALPPGTGDPIRPPSHEAP